MTYKEYQGFTKAYIVVHCTGFGVMEAPYVEHDVVFETDDIDVAMATGKDLIIKNNSIKEIESSWIPNTYQINVNILSEKGKSLHKKFKKDFDDRLAKIKECGEHKTYKYNGMTIYMQPHPAFDEPDHGSETNNKKA